MMTETMKEIIKIANEMAIEVDTGTYTIKAIGIGLLEQIAEQIAEQLKEGGAGNERND